MNKNRPVNLDISTMRLPITALVSITHRVTGVVLLAGILGLIWMLDLSLASEESFNQLKDCLAQPFVKIALIAVLAALAYHLVAGVRHLIMDLGVGESKEGGKLGAKIAVALSVVLIVLMGIWVW